jgi:hypothetical protein
VPRVYTRVPPIDRFNEKWVRDEVTGCHVWTASVGSHGRPLLHVHGIGNVLASRFIMMYEREVPENVDEMYVCHAPVICHNPLCVNPEHLRWATPSENSFDKNLDGTMPSNRGMGKVTEDDVRAIRADQGTTTEIGRRYGIHPSQVSRIKNRKTWFHIP